MDGFFNINFIRRYGVLENFSELKPLSLCLFSARHLFSYSFFLHIVIPQSRLLDFCFSPKKELLFSVCLCTYQEFGCVLCILGLAK